MKPKKSNVVLIGMAGCGKSSVGRLLANHLDRAFLDTDDLIVRASGKPLQDILDQKGPEYFKQVEEEVLRSVTVRNHVIATGGSSIYSGNGIEHLRKYGIIILLEVDLDTLKQRVGDTSDRGLVKQPGQSFEKLFKERLPLYKKYADVTLDCSDLDHQGVCNAIIEVLQKTWGRGNVSFT